MVVKVLRPFQERGVTKIVNVGKGCMLLWVGMGLGKSPIAARVASILACRRIVIAVRDSGIKVWSQEGTNPEIFTGLDWLKYYFHPLPVIVHRMDKYQPSEREDWWNIQTPDTEVHVWVVVYNTLGLDMAQVNREQKRKAKKKQPDKAPRVLRKLLHSRFKADLIICDECKRISNTDTAGYLGVYRLRYDHNVPYILMLSGTPGDRGPQSFFAYWQLIDRKKFSSYWAYVEHFHTIDVNYWGGRLIVEQRQDTLAEWNRLLDRYAYVVDEHDPEIQSERPPLQRDKLYCEMMPDQQNLYNDIRKYMMSLVGDDVIVAQNSMVQFLRLRQALICPQILSPELSVGGAIRQFCDLLEDANAEERHTVIFTPFTRAFGPFTAYLKERGFPNVFHLQGGISANAQQERIDAWRGTKGVMLNSIQYAEAYSLEPATKCYFIGIEYSPDANAQAEKRLQRLTTKVPITANYFTYGTKVDERMVDIIAIKQEYIDLSKPQALRHFLEETL